MGIPIKSATYLFRCLAMKVSTEAHAQQAKRLGKRGPATLQSLHAP